MRIVMRRLMAAVVVLLAGINACSSERTGTEPLGQTRDALEKGRRHDPGGKAPAKIHILWNGVSAFIQDVPPFTAFVADEANGELPLPPPFKTGPGGVPPQLGTLPMEFLPLGMFPPPYQVNFRADPVEVTFLPVVGNQPGPPIVLRSQTELHLFARSPGEELADLASLGDNDMEWITDTSVPPSIDPLTGQPFVRYSLPFDVVMPFEAAPFFSHGMMTLMPAQTSDFWFFSDFLGRIQGKGADPSGVSSIKALRVLPSGLCSREATFADVGSTTGLLSQIANGFAQGFLGPDGACTPELFAEVSYVEALPILTEVPDPSSPFGRSPGGGFLLTSHVRVHGTALPESAFSDCTIYFLAQYSFQLDSHGVLSLALAPSAASFPTHLVANDSTLCTGLPGPRGTGFTGAVTALTDALKKTLPLQFATATHQAQTREPLASRPCSSDADCASEAGILGGGTCNMQTHFCANFFDCDPKSALGTQCDNAIKVVSDAVGLGAATLGIAAGAASMETAIQNPGLWSCVDVSIPGNFCAGVAPITRGRCEITVPAKRINVNPDTIELVWFDTPDEFTNPAFAAFAAFFGTSVTIGNIDFNAFRELCARQSYGTNSGIDPNDLAGMFYNRRFTNFHIGDEACPSVPPPPPQCPCTQNSDCKSGVCQSGMCAFECTDRLQCPGPQVGCSFPFPECFPDCVNGVCIGTICDPLNPNSCPPYATCEPGLFGAPQCFGTSCDSNHPCPSNEVCQFLANGTTECLPPP